MKKIMHLLSSNKLSGAENVVTTIIDNNKSEFDFIYCSPVGIIETQLEEKSISFIGINNLSYKEVRKVVKTFRPDVIHAHDFKASIVASLFSNSTKVISHIHQNPKWLERINPKTLIYAYSLRRIDKVIFLSQSIKNSFKFKNKFNEKIDILSNYIDKSYVLNQAELLQDNDLEEYFDLIYLGRFEEVKNPFRFLKIVEIIESWGREISVIMVGDGSLFQLAQKISAEKNLNIKFVGEVDNPYSFLCKSKILVNTSIEEGQPLSILESYTLGIPVISTKKRGIHDLVNENVGGVYENDSEVAKRIVQLLDSNSEYEKVSINAITTSNIFNNLNDWKNRIKGLYND